MASKLNILFICKSNLFRSKIAEYCLKKTNKNVNVKSAGVVMRSDLSKEQAEAIKEEGIILNKKQQPLTSKLLREQNLIIITAEDVPLNLLNKSFLKSIGVKARIIKWGIKDIYDIKGKDKKERTKKTIKKIINRVDLLNRQLEKGKWKQ